MDDLKLAIDSNFALKSTKDWFLREAPYDVIIQVDGVSFPLHKAPLVSRSGLLRRLVREDEDCSQLELTRLPGGAHGFELAAKFCYGVKLEVHAANVALLRCIAEHLEMAEDYSIDNLILESEAYLEEILRKDFSTVVKVLHSCDKLVPLAEKLHIVARSVDAAVSLLANFRAAPSSTRSSTDSSSYFGAESTTNIDFDTSARSSRSSYDLNPNNNNNNNNNKGLLWWMEDLSTLSLPLFETIIKALISKGLPSQTISHALLHYAHKCFEGLAKEQALTWHTNFRTSQHHVRSSQHHDDDPQQQQKHDTKILETIVNLLPAGEKNAVPLNLLLELLRITLLLHLPGTSNCRVNLERRIASRLHHASLDDLLIPSFSKDQHSTQNGAGSADGTTYDVEATRRLFAAFLQLHADHDFNSSSDDGEDEDEDVGRNREGGGKVKRLTPVSMTKVAYLVDSYLAEVAPDSHLSAAEFTAIADLLPEHARTLDDGVYRAVDIYLKAHPALTDEERKKLCKVVDFHKLSHDACVHAAQNERLPLPTVVQVLYLEQMKIRDEISTDHVPNTPPISHPSPVIAPNPAANQHLALVPATANSDSIHETSHNHHHNSTNSVGALIVHPAVSCASSSNTGDHYASVRRENMELKLEVARMRMRLCDIEKEHTNMKHDIEKTHTDHEHHSSQHSDHHNDHHTSAQPHSDHYTLSQPHSEHHTSDHISRHPPPAARTGGSNSSSHGSNHHHHGGFFHAVSKTLSKLNVFHHPKHHSHHHEEHDQQTDEHADHLHHNNNHHQSRSPNHHSSHHKSPSHHHHHHHSSHHKSPSHHHHSSSHHRSPSHHHHSSSHPKSPSHHSSNHRSPSHHSSHHRSPSHHSSHYKSPSHHHRHHDHSSHHKSPSHHHHSSHHKSPSHHSHHHSSHHKSPSRHHHHRHYSSHHRRDSATPSPEHHSSHSRHHASPSPADHHSNHSHHKSPNNHSRHSSSSSERHHETSRHRHYSPSPDHRSHHSSHSRHRSSDHDGHHHHQRSHYHHHRDHHGHGHGRSHHGHRRHHSPSSNSSTSPIRERDHHSRSASPDRHHHHSLHRSPSPDYHHHRSHHKSHEHHHQSSRSPTPHDHGHGHGHHTAHHSSNSRDHHHRSQHRSHSHNHHSDNDYHAQESDHHGDHHQGHHTHDPSHLHEALKAAGNQHESQHSDHHHGQHKDHQSQEGRKR